MSTPARAVNHISVSTNEFLTRSSSQIVRTVALGFLGSAGLVFVISLIAELISPSGGTLVFLAALSCVLIGAPLTLIALRTRPPSVAVAPMAGGLCAAVVIAALLLPDLRFAVTPFMGFVVVLISIAGGRRVTPLMIVLCTVLVVVIILVPPLSDLSVGWLAVVLQSSAPPIFTLLIGIVADRFLATQSSAVALTEARAAEAEAARAEAEAARAAAESQNAEQRRLLDLIQALELPVLAVGKGILAVPLLGNLDSRRIAAITTAVLDSVARERAHTVVFDITGVNAIDSAVAQALVEATQAVRLLGARPLVSGVRPSVAQTLTILEVPLHNIEPVADLQEALSAAARLA